MITKVAKVVKISHCRVAKFQIYSSVSHSFVCNSYRISRSQQSYIFFNEEVKFLRPVHSVLTTGNKFKGKGEDIQRDFIKSFGERFE